MSLLFKKPQQSLCFRGGELPWREETDVKEKLESVTKWLVSIAQAFCLFESTYRKL